MQKKKINNTEWRIPDLKAVLVNKFNAGEEHAHCSPLVLQCSELGPSGVLQILPVHLSPSICVLSCPLPSPICTPVSAFVIFALPGAPLCDVICDVLGWICVPFLLALTMFHLPFSSVQFSCSVVSNSLRPHESQHARPPCPSPTPGVHPNSCALSR